MPGSQQFVMCRVVSDPARKARHCRVPSTCNTHGLASLSRMSREPILAWWALWKESQQGRLIQQLREAGDKNYVILVALEKGNHPAVTGTAIMELDAMEKPVLQSL